MPSNVRDDYTVETSRHYLDSKSKFPKKKWNDFVPVSRNEILLRLPDGYDGTLLYFPGEQGSQATVEQHEKESRRSIDDKCSWLGNENEKHKNMDGSDECEETQPVEGNDDAESQQKVEIHETLQQSQERCGKITTPPASF